MLQLNFEEALTIIDYHQYVVYYRDPARRRLYRDSEAQVFKRARYIVEQRGHDWVLLILAYEENMRKLNAYKVVNDEQRIKIAEKKAEVKQKFNTKLNEFESKHQAQFNKNRRQKEEREFQKNKMTV